jgi:uncharacterized protein (UPF0264 family)
LDHVPKLLVSVRSALEARVAAAAGSAILDVKEPLRGSLGRARCSVWQEIRAAVPACLPLSVALGELTEWIGAATPDVQSSSWAGISYCKLGLASAPSDWPGRWKTLRRRVIEVAAQPPAWIGVVYIDWQRASAPPPEEIIPVCLQIAECRGVLFDTWDKARRAQLEPGWGAWLERIRVSGRLVALAGSVDAASIPRLAALEPDITAVRGAACRGGDRLAAIDPARVAQLVDAVRNLGRNPNAVKAVTELR